MQDRAPTGIVGVAEVDDVVFDDVVEERLEELEEVEEVEVLE